MLAVATGGATLEELKTRRIGRWRICVNSQPKRFVAAPPDALQWRCGLPVPHMPHEVGTPNSSPLPQFDRRSGGKGGKFLGQFFRATMRAFRPPPVAGAHEDFAVPRTIATMKFVDRHGLNLIRSWRRLNWVFGTPPRPVHHNRNIRLLLK